MNVIRHDNELAKFVTLAVKMTKSCFDDFTQLQLSQHACTVALVQPILEPLREPLEIVPAVRIRVRFGMRAHPFRTFSFPLPELLSWQ